MLGGAGMRGVEGVGGRQEVAGGEPGAERGERRERRPARRRRCGARRCRRRCRCGRQRADERDGAGQVVGVGDEGDEGARAAGRRGRAAGRRWASPWRSVRPEGREREGDRVEGRDADLLVVLEGGDKGPGAVAEREGLEGPGGGIDEPEVRDASGAVDPALGVRSIRRVLGLRTSQAQSGARSNHGASGKRAIRSRRQPARSGTSTSVPKCNSGSSRIHQPPGPPRIAVERTADPYPERRAARAWRERGAAAGAARPRSARRPCSPGRRGRPDRWRGAVRLRRAGSSAVSIARRRERVIRPISARGARGRARRAWRSPWSRRRRRGCASGRRGRRTSSPPRPPR